MQEPEADPQLDAWIEEVVADLGGPGVADPDEACDLLFLRHGAQIDADKLAQRGARLLVEELVASGALVPGVTTDAEIADVAIRELQRRVRPPSGNRRWN
jgi:hypothetical protein